MNTVMVFAGTSEGRAIVDRLSALPVRCIVSVATDYGSAMLVSYKSAVEVLEGRMNALQMSEAIRSKGVGLVIDATHPYAADVSANIKKACEAENVELWRLVRQGAALGQDPDLECFPDVLSLVERLNGLEGNVLLTTGSKDLAAFTKVNNYRQRLYPRVLPAMASLEACERLGYDRSRIICMQGPFSRAFNEAMMREFHIKLLVTKDSGQAGGFFEKLEASRACGVRILILGRPTVEEGFSLSQIEAALKEKYR